MNFFRWIYHRLPVIKELRQIAYSLMRMESNVRRQTLQQLNQYAHFTLLQQDRYKDPKRLNRHEHQVFSQNGEDGILTEILRRVGVKDKFFVEIGVGDGLENNTAFLLSQGWQGRWIEGNAEQVESIRRNFKTQLKSGQLGLANGFVKAENIDGLFQGLKIPPEFDVLSLDVDRNTYWIWAALKNFRPRVAVIEYNASFPPSVDWKVEYAADRVWNETSYMGASLKALELLGRELGYSLVGCDLGGVNAFFVRNDLAGDKFAEPFTAENHYEPPRYFLIRREAHPAGVGDSPQ